MRYDDCPTTDASVRIAASPAEVWGLVSDIALPARFSPELQSAEWLDGATGPALGARFRGRSRHQAIGEWETTCVVTELEPQRSFGWAVGDPDHPSARWRFDIQPEGDGVRLTQWCQLGPARSGLNAAIEAMPDKEERIVARRLEEHRVNMQANVEGVKAIAEGGAS